MSIVTGLTGVHVHLMPQMPVAGLLGASKPTKLGGDILIDDKLPLAEQRVTLLHELKHIIDGGHQAQLRINGHQHGGEGLCTAFALNVLMPADWLRRDWLDGIRSISALAERYQAPIESVEQRLHGLGLLKHPRAGPILPPCQWHPHINNERRD